MQPGRVLTLAHILPHVTLWRVYRVVYVAPLGELCTRSDRQALELHQYDIMCQIALLQEDQELR
jgi:hypothetical protein